MVSSYVAALNTPGTVPNVQKAWDVFVSTKCTQVKAAAIESYDKTMESEMAGKLPCERDVIRQAQAISLERALKLFEEETFGISTANIENYLSELTVRTLLISLCSCYFFKINLTNRFHVALRLFRKRSQLTSIRGNNKKKGSRGDIRVCH